MEGAVFAETIPFSETRDYVKQVLSGATYYAALLGSNGMNSAQGGQLLGTLAVLLVLGWLAALWLARHLAHWGQARGWSTVADVASVAVASGGAVVAFSVLALLSTLTALLWVGA